MSVKELSMLRKNLNMIVQFFCHMRDFWLDDLKLATRFEYHRRRFICAICNKDKMRCPVCGCFLRFYCKIKSSKCGNWKHYTFIKTQIKPEHKGEI